MLIASSTFDGSLSNVATRAYKAPPSVELNAQLKRIHRRVLKAVRAGATRSMGTLATLLPDRANQLRLAHLRAAFDPKPCSFAS
jgi:hypothetical protein